MVALKDALKKLTERLTIYTESVKIYNTLFEEEHHEGVQHR